MCYNKNTLLIIIYNKCMHYSVININCTLKIMYYDSFTTNLKHSAKIVFSWGLVDSILQGTLTLVSLDSAH